MKPAANFRDFFLGALCGTAATILLLAALGLVDGDVLLVGQVAGLGFSLLVVARLLKLPPFNPDDGTG